jgi:hypothetical protein
MIHSRVVSSSVATTLLATMMCWGDDWNAALRAWLRFQRLTSDLDQRVANKKPVKRNRGWHEKGVDQRLDRTKSILVTIAIIPRHFLSSSPYIHVTATNFFLGFVAAGTGLPAVALCLGYSKPITDGLGRIPEAWKISNECKFGLYLYTAYDIVLAMVCGASLVLKNNVVPIEVALAATVAHQCVYVAAATAAFGFQTIHAASAVAATVAAGLLLVIMRTLLSNSLGPTTRPRRTRFITEERQRRSLAVSGASRSEAAKPS